jgi:hypothetical protein
MVSESGGLDFEPRPRISLHVIISAYKSPYGGAHVAQTSGRAAGAWLVRNRGNVGLSIKAPPRVLLYHLSFIIGLTWGLSTWYSNQEVSSSSHDHAYFVAHNNYYI